MSKGCVPVAIKVSVKKIRPFTLQDYTKEQLAKLISIMDWMKCLWSENKYKTLSKSNGGNHNSIPCVVMDILKIT